MNGCKFYKKKKCLSSNVRQENIDNSNMFVYYIEYRNYVCVLTKSSQVSGVIVAGRHVVVVSSRGADNAGQTTREEIRQKSAY